MRNLNWKAFSNPFSHNAKAWEISTCGITMPYTAFCTRRMSEVQALAPPKMFRFFYQRIPKKTLPKETETWFKASRSRLESLGTNPVLSRDLRICIVDIALCTKMQYFPPRLGSDTAVWDKENLLNFMRFWPSSPCFRTTKTLQITKPWNSTFVDFLSEMKKC